MAESFPDTSKDMAKRSAPEADDLIIETKPEEEMTQADWDMRAGSRAEAGLRESLKRKMRAHRPEFIPDRDDG